MIKLIDLLTEAVIACGKCLSYVWKISAKFSGNKSVNKKMKIVYGTVQNKWISDGKRYRHAWIEYAGKVMDWQTMEAGLSKYAGKGWPKKEFYKHWHPKIDRIYSPSEVINNYAEKKTIIGWDW